MFDESEYTLKAGRALKSHWLLAAKTGFIASLLGSYTVMKSNCIIIIFDFLKKIIEEHHFSDNVIRIYWGLVICELLISIVCGAITLGYVKFNLDLVDGNKPDSADLFSQDSHIREGFLLQLLRIIFVCLGTLLLIIPGIVAAYSYAMAPYILYEHPELKAIDALRISKSMMVGNRINLFWLRFSFIGWHILCIFTLGIGYLWLIPYQEAAYAAFYRDIKEEYHGGYDVNYLEDIESHSDYADIMQGWDPQ